MDKKALRKMQDSREFRRLIQNQGAVRKKRHTLLILIILALILYFIFTKANIYLVIGLTVLLILLMRR